MHPIQTIRFALPAAALLLLLAGCAAPAATTTPDAPADADTSGTSVDTTTDDGGSDDGAMLVLSGTGRYAIGTEMPFGGYQLHGEPDAQPAGCTWAILDADGGTTFENDGQYVFITDIPEAATFVTDGCPDWEQFE